MKIILVKFVTVSYAFTSCRKRWPTKLADSNKLQRIDAKPNRETDAEFPIKIAPGSYLIYRMHFRMLPGHQAALQSILESVTIKWCNLCQNMSTSIFDIASSRQVGWTAVQLLTKLLASELFFLIASVSLSKCFILHIVN